MKDLNELPKELPKEFKTETEDGKIKIVIPKEYRHLNFRLFDLIFSDGTYAATMSWQGMSQDGEKEILQPCVKTLSTGADSLAFDGQVHYNWGNDTVVLPAAGTIYTVQVGNTYFFDRLNPLIHNEMYNLVVNNLSIRMNNISLFDAKFTKGVMLDFRASMEGTFTDEEKTGNIVILAAIDTIN